MAQHIVVVKYDPAWAAMFEKERKIIQSILKENCTAIYHIGSTSVPGLKAKPIIDILPVVKDLSKVEETAPRFEKIGYEYLGEFGIPGRRYLRKGGDERTHQIHIFEVSNKKEIERHLAVRNFLRTHTGMADEYGCLKETLARTYPYDIDGYCDGKDKFLKELEQRAVLWNRTEGQIYRED